MAADLTLPQQDGVLRSISDIPPTHYILKLQLFSQLSKHKVERYTSTDFNAGGYKWRLVLLPNGNKDKGITDHISIYLMIVDGKPTLPPGWEIRAVFRLYLLDQNNDTYLTLQDTVEKGRRFNGLKPEWGFDKFIPHTTFNDAAKGYLVNDTCVFGAEVYVSQEKCTGKGECLSMLKDAVSYKHTWRIENYNSLTEECVDSKTFSTADHKWKVQLYPKGNRSGTGSHVSLYLTLAEPENLPPATKVYAEFKLRILDQLNRQHYSVTANHWFSASDTSYGWQRLVTHGYFYYSGTGLLVKNVCIVEAEVTIHGVASAL